METFEFETSKLPKILKQYCVYQRQVQGVLDQTIYQRLIHLKPFVRALGTRSTPSMIGSVKPAFVHRYVLKTAPGFSRKYQKEFLCSLRSFFKFLNFSGLTSARLIDALPKLPTWQLSEVPRGIPWTDVEKLLAMPNRKSANGKRNYALLLLSATYGVRHAQARKLQFKDVLWREQRIHFASCKGGRPLDFPLYEDVASALLDYIQNGRPQSDLTEIFLQRGPMPLAGNSLNTMMKAYYRRAGIPASTAGFHAIRHAFATRLMNQQTPLKDISDILGHSSIKSTLCYTKVDLSGLQQFAREWLVVNHD